MIIARRAASATHCAARKKPTSRSGRRATSWALTGRRGRIATRFRRENSVAAMVMEVAKRDVVISPNRLKEDGVTTS